MQSCAPSKRPRSLLKGLVLGGTLALLALFCSVPIYLVEKLIRPKKPARFEDYFYTPFELNIPAEAVTFPARSGDRILGGWFLTHPTTTTTILVCPGYRTHKTDTLGIAHLLWRAGHTVLIFDYYGHGTRSGTPVTLGYREMQDFLGAVDYVKQRVPATRIGVLAYSMGAAIAIMCSTQLPEIEALVADSSFATHTSVVDYNIRQLLHLPLAPFLWLADRWLGWRAGYHFHQVEPLRDIPYLSPRPILIIHGGRDSVVSPSDAFQLYVAAREPRELWIVAEADHCGAYFANRHAYVERVISFFNTHLELQLMRPHLVEVTPTGQEQQRELRPQHASRRGNLAV